MSDMKQASGYYDLANMRFKDGADKAAKGEAPDFDQVMGLNNMSRATRMAMETLFARIERLHQKIDRIEKKLG